MSTRQAATHVVVKHDQYGGTPVVRCAGVEVADCVGVLGSWLAAAR